MSDLLKSYDATGQRFLLGRLYDSDVALLPFDQIIKDYDRSIYCDDVSITEASLSKLIKHKIKIIDCKSVHLNLVKNQLNLDTRERVDSFHNVFNNVKDDFNCSDHAITTLEKGPYWVGGNYICDHNQLTSLDGCPQILHHDFNCRNNLLTSLEGGPTTVGVGYYAAYNKISSLKGLPSKVGETLNLKANDISSLVGIHKQLTFCREIDLTFNPIVRGGIGLIFIDGLKSIRKYVDDPFFGPCSIIDHYLGTGKSGLLECQEALISADFEDYAEL